MRRRSWLFVALTVAVLALASAYGWLAFSRSDLILGIVAIELLGVALLFVPSLRDLSSPVLVADDYGLRMHTSDGWVGLLWSEIDSIGVVKGGFLRPRQLQVVTQNMPDPYRVPCGIAVNAKSTEVERQLAIRRSAAAY